MSSLGVSETGNYMESGDIFKVSARSIGASLREVWAELFVFGLAMSWIWPGFALDAFKHPFSGNELSYVPFGVMLCVMLIHMIIIIGLEWGCCLWTCSSRAWRYAYLLAIYVSCNMVTVWIVGRLNRIEMVEYFGGDAGGSFLMFCGPSMIMYSFLFVVILIVNYIGTLIRSAFKANE